MGRVVLSCAVWSVEDRGGWRTEEEPLLGRKRKLGAGLASPPSHTAAITRQFHSWVSSSTGSAAPHSCAAPPQAEDQAASIYSSLNLDSLVEGKGRPSDKKPRQLSLVSVVLVRAQGPHTR